jgi:glycosyltransferase involved in cell wall biosynthesis
MTETHLPSVSIVLPTFNRARFLKQAIDSILNQKFADWELIVIDDGSTDETPELLQELTARIEQPAHYIRQENQGAYGARNAGLEHARGRYVAFFDSDDEWLPHHLQDCVTALESNPDVDWAYGACRIVEEAGKVVSESAFYVQGVPRPFLGLNKSVRGRLHVIDDADAARCMISHGLYCGLQNSVIRRTVFADDRFESTTRNEAEDQLIVIRALLRGHRFAYFDNVHVVYHIHEGNSSAAARHGNVERKLRIQHVLLEGFERLAREHALPRRERRALRRRLSQEYFWLLGYSLQWSNGRHAEALASFRRGIAYAPYNLRLWKTYLIAATRAWFGRSIEITR